MNERRVPVHLRGIGVDQIACLAHDTAQRTPTCVGKQLMPRQVCPGRPADSTGALLHEVHVALRVHRYRLCTQSQIPCGVTRSKDEGWTTQAPRFECSSMQGTWTVQLAGQQLHGLNQRSIRLPPNLGVS